MYNDEITFDKLPQAITYLTRQVEELKELVSILKPNQSNKRVLIEIDDACRIIMKAKPTIYALARKGLIPSYKKGKKLYFYEDELLKWIENGKKDYSQQNHEEMLHAIQSGMKRKPRNAYNS